MDFMKKMRVEKYHSRGQARIGVATAHLNLLIRYGAHFFLNQ